MASASAAVAFFALCLSISVVQDPSFLDHPPSTKASGQASPFDGALQIMLPLAAMEAIFTAVAFIYGRLHHVRGAGAGAGAGNRRVSEESELVTFVLCVSAGILEFFFVQPAGGVDGCVLGTAALHALPAAATVTFFLAMALIFVHIRASGAGAGAAPAVWIISKMTVGAAATLVSLMAMAAFYVKFPAP